MDRASCWPAWSRFFAILFTGRYPRRLFDFNVGVLRWTWRVTYYAYGALGTDRYPPFTLADVPDYPAQLDVVVPDAAVARTGAGEVVAAGDPPLPGALLLRRGRPLPRRRGGGLVGILVLVAAVVLLFTDRYPTSIFDLVVGMNRWVLRVAAYAGLMTDEYPPFRLDQGGDDPGGFTVPAPAPAPEMSSGAES